MSTNSLIKELAQLTSEQANPESHQLDELDSLAIVHLMNKQDTNVSSAIAHILPAIAQAVECIREHLLHQGRLIYIGAGTSGRLGVLDASECPPTFGTSPDQIIGIIAGGPSAMFKAQEGAEDDPALGKQDLQALTLTKHDVVVGIAASGRTPYVLGALDYAKQVGAATIALCCNANAPITQKADIKLTPVVGPEVLAGSTRLKAGSAQKMVLNMLSTASMIKLGKCYQNYMVDLKASNLKLQARSQRMLMQITDCSEAQAADYLAQAQGELKVAILIALSGINPIKAHQLLSQTTGHLKEALRISLTH